VIVKRIQIEDWMGAPQYSLITCTTGRREELRRLLDSLVAQDVQEFELVVVDQGPAGCLDRLIDEFKCCFSIQHLRSTPGLSRSRNLGIRHARGEFLGFPDDDCWYPTDVVARVTVRRRENPTLDLMLGKTVDEKGSDSLGSFRRKSGAVSKWNVWTSGNSSSIFVRRQLAIDAGGFDETLGVGANTRFQSGEETDFILRILAAGTPAYYDSELKIHHPQVDCSISRAQAYSPGFGRVLRKHRYGVLYLLYRVVRTAVSCVLAAAVLDSGRVRYKILWAVGTLQGYWAKYDDTSKAWPVREDCF
jgi:glycosyltransferase involved in cell wall biosynthesis